MQTEASWLVNAPIFTETAGWNLGTSGLRIAIVARKFAFRQGLWIEDIRIPPGQECSNGSLILLAVVLWRTFLACHYCGLLSVNSKEAHRMSMSYETP
jgi:hypothetical protein